MDIYATDIELGLVEVVTVPDIIELGMPKTEPEKSKFLCGIFRQERAAELEKQKLTNKGRKFCVER